jgi:hypothetical protein
LISKFFYSYDASFDDLENEEFLEKPLDLVIFHLMKHMTTMKLKMLIIFYVLEGITWDISCFDFDRDPIYETDDDYRVKNEELLPLEQPTKYINDSYFWKHEEDMFTDWFQPLKDGLL